jgi:hypothetical protein
MTMGKHHEEQGYSERDFFMCFLRFPTRELKISGKILYRGFLITR